MSTESELSYLGGCITNWSIPRDLSNFLSYGLWNSLGAYNHTGELVGIAPAHDGDYFPANPLDYIELIRDAVISGKADDYVFWPIQADIDITQRCTANCIFCYSRPYAFNTLYRDAEISVATFENILKELAEGGTRVIRFTGGGEPLLHSEIKTILPMPHRYGLQSCIITNGDLLDEEVSKLMVYNVDHIRVSVNAAQDSTRQLLHRPVIGVNNLSKIFEQIEYIAQLRQTIWPSQKRPLIWATYLIVPKNISEIYSTAQILRDCGVDSISFRRVYHERSGRFSTSELDILHQQLCLASELHSPPTFQVFTPKRDITKAWHISQRTLFARCISCRMRTVIEATNLGPMIKVCGLNRGIGIYGERKGVPGESLGVIGENTSFFDLWNSNDTKKKLANRPEICVKNCSVISINITLNRIYEILVNNPESIIHKCWHRNSIV